MQLPSIQVQNNQYQQFHMVQNKSNAHIELPKEKKKGEIYNLFGLYIWIVENGILDVFKAVKYAFT